MTFRSLQQDQAQLAVYVNEIARLREIIETAAVRFEMLETVSGQRVAMELRKELG